MKRYISLITALIMIASLLIPGVAFANAADLQTVVQQIKDSPNKADILQSIWDSAVAEIVDNNNATPDSVYNRLDQNKVGNWIGEGSGKIAEDSVKLIIQKLINNKATLVDFYNDLTGILSILKLTLSMGDATDGQALVSLEQYIDGILELNSQQTGFQVNTTKTASVYAEIGITGSLATNMNALLSQSAVKLNNNMDNFGLSVSEINSILSLFAITSDDGGGGGGGGTTTPPATPPATQDDTASDMNEAAGEALNATPTQAAEITNNAAVTVNNYTNGDPAAADAAKNVIDNLKSAVSSATEQEGAQLESSAQKLAQTAVDKVGTQAVTGQVSNGAASVQVDTNTANSIIDNIDTVVQKTNELNQSLKDAGMDAQAKPVLKIKVEAEGTVDSSQVKLPSNIFKAAADKAIDKISIDTPVAKIDISPNAITTGENDTVDISASKVNTSELSNGVKAQVGDAQVYNFDLKVNDTKVSNFSKPVEITVPYTPKAGEDTEKITVYYINDNGELENVTGVYDAESGTVKFSTDHFSQYVVKVNNVTFADLGSYGWAKQYIEVMASKGAINGVGEGMFKPGSDVTRAEFAAMVVRALKLTVADAPAKFSDVKEGSWYYTSVNSAAEWGIVSGKPDGTFAPNDKISRQDMAVIVANALKAAKQKQMRANAAANIEKFSDKSDVSSYAAGSIGMNVRFSILNGKADGSFAPKANANRAEAAAVLYRLFFTN